MLTRLKSILFPSTAVISVIKRFVATPFTVYAREIAGGLEISLYTRALIAQTGVGGMKALKVSDK